MTLLRSICIFLGTLSAVHTAASVPRSSRRISLNSRQVPDVPPQCDTTCDPVDDILASGNCSPSQCCTPLFQSGYFGCLECVGMADNATVAEFAQAQGLVDNLTIACSEEGFALPELTLPGQNPNRTLATVPVGSSHSASTFSQITVSAPPSTTSAAPTISQKTITSLPSQPAAPSSTSPTGTGAATPTTSTNAGYTVRFDTCQGLPSLMVAGWMVLCMQAVLG
ncbi:hypothetical protein DFH07DRAFT_402933 [Mycena maculata]|uniref:Uncharacterized protein n=1 Tax=Mycena maculata TaxID=230809 RepID=A0AAD7JDR6_9AGAR|nr:hypothetical protein DFH07DRAFT_402933 [Mycena maculata]